MTKCCCYIFQFLCSLARYKERKRDKTFKLLKIFQWVQALHLSLVRKSFINLNESPMSRCCCRNAVKKCPNIFKREEQLVNFTVKYIWTVLTSLSSECLLQTLLTLSINFFLYICRYFKLLFFLLLAKSRSS